MMEINIEEISTRIIEWHHGEESISEDGLFDDVWEALEEWIAENGIYIFIIMDMKYPRTSGYQMTPCLLTDKR